MQAASCIRRVMVPFATIMPRVSAVIRPRPQVHCPRDCWSQRGWHEGHHANCHPEATLHPSATRGLVFHPDGLEPPSAGRPQRLHSFDGGDLRIHQVTIASASISTR
jgi:hypothetical protein